MAANQANRGIQRSLTANTFRAPPVKNVTTAAMMARVAGDMVSKTGSGRMTTTSHRTVGPMRMTSPIITTNAKTATSTTNARITATS